MKTVPAIAALTLAVLVLSSCEGFDLVGTTTMTDAGNPEEGKKFLVEALNYWVGRSKDERIRVFGTPVQCNKSSSGLEVCEWKTPRQQVAFNYDPTGIARSWSYRGEYGQFTNANHQRVKATSIATTQKASQKAGTARTTDEWVHPTKGKDEFNQDFYHCRGVIENDPKLTGANIALQTGKDFFSDEQMTTCLQKAGWSPK